MDSKSVVKRVGGVLFRSQCPVGSPLKDALEPTKVELRQRESSRTEVGFFNLLLPETTRTITECPQPSPPSRSFGQQFKELSKFSHSILIFCMNETLSNNLPRLQRQGHLSHLYDWWYWSTRCFSFWMPTRLVGSIGFSYNDAVPPFFDCNLTKESVHTWPRAFLPFTEAQFTEPTTCVTSLCFGTALPWVGGDITEVAEGRQSSLLCTSTL